MKTGGRAVERFVERHTDPLVELRSYPRHLARMVFCARGAAARARATRGWAR